MAKLTEDEQNAIERAIWSIRCHISNEAGRYYENTIFEPDFPGQNHIEKYTSLWAREDEEIINRLWDIIYNDAETDEIVAAFMKLDDAQA